MRTRLALASLTLGAAFVASLVGVAPARAAGEEKPYAAILEAKAPMVVTVKSVVKWSFSGHADAERNDERNGVVVDPEGLVMVQNYGLGRGSMQARATPDKIRVLFDGDEKEYEAILGATDSKLGLAFIRIRDLAGKKVNTVNFAEGVDPKIGDEVVGVLRTDQGFDYAPYFALGRIAGQVTKPRAMWLLASFGSVGQPLYSTEGKVVGVAVRQAGISEEGSSERYFLLPVKAVAGVVSQATKAATKALEDAKAHEAEAAKDKEKEGGTAPAPGTPTAPGMEEPAPGMDVPPPHGPTTPPPTPGMGP